MDYRIEKVKYISHEVKNQISICDLYLEILERYCDKNSINDETIKNSLSKIKSSLSMASNSLSELKSSYSQELKQYCAKDIIEEAYNLSKVYGISKNIDINLDLKLESQKILVDKVRFQSVIINIVKNACEAFEDEPEKKIKIYSGQDGNYLKINISNNAKPIENVDIFKQGITTKESGSGLGLYISENNINEMGGKLELLKSDNDSTDFMIMVKII